MTTKHSRTPGRPRQFDPGKPLKPLNTYFIRADTTR